MAVRNLVLLAVGLVVSACSDPPPPPASGPIQVVDEAGETVALDGPPQRIVSLIPSFTETIIALGAADRLVARTDYDRDPAIAHLPSLGQALDPNPEAIAGFDLDLIISWRSSPDSETPRTAGLLGIPVYQGETGGLGGFFETVEKLGVLLGLEAEAAALAADVRGRLDAVREASLGETRPTVMYVVWPDPPQIAGPGTYLDSLIHIAGGRNAFHDAPVEWPQMSLEEIVSRDPDIVIAAARHDRPADSIGWLDGAGWRELSARREGRLHSVEADLFNRPGPRVGEAAEQLAEIIRGGSR